MRQFESINRPCPPPPSSASNGWCRYLAIELPLWEFVNTGGRFRVFPQAGARNTYCRGRTLEGSTTDPAASVGRRSE